MQKSLADALQDTWTLSAYLEAHNLTIVYPQGQVAVSTRGSLDIDGHHVPYHLVGSYGVLCKAQKWAKLSEEDRFTLIRERGNPTSRAALENTIRHAVQDVLEIAKRGSVKPDGALKALLAEEELVAVRCELMRERIAATVVRFKEQWQAEASKDSVNLALYPESFRLATGMKRRFVALLGPTNSGKTHAAMEHLAQAKSGAYLAPLRLLALENYERLRNQGLAVSLITGEQKKLAPDATHVASTVEMLNSNQAIEVAVIDEIQLLEDKDRGAAWTAAVCGVPAETVYLVGALEAKEAIEALVKRLGCPLEVRKFSRKTPLEMEATEVGSIKKLRPGDVVVAFSRREVLLWRDQLVAAGYSVATIYGALSPEVRQAQADRFISGEASIVVGTDALGMGLNTPAKRVVFTTALKFDGYSENLLSPAMTRQIAGRAGRFGQHEAGHVAGFDANTHRQIAALLKQKVHPLPTAGFFVAPNLDYLKQIREATGEKRLQRLLELFSKHVEVHDEFFLPADLAEQTERAAWLDLLQLSLEDRFLFSLCPIPTKVPVLGKALSTWAKQREQGVKAYLDERSCPPNLNLLQFAEDSCKVYSAYAWLSYRLPETFVDGEKAQMLMQKASDSLDRLLQAQNSMQTKRGKIGVATERSSAKTTRGRTRR